MWASPDTPFTVQTTRVTTGVKLLSLPGITFPSSLSDETFHCVLKHTDAFKLFMGEGGEIMVALNVYEQRKEKVEGCSDSDRHTEKVWEDQWRCQGDGWGRSSSARQSLERKSLKGECTETRLINNDPGMLKLLCWLYMNKKKKTCWCLEWKTPILLLSLSGHN